MPKVRVTITIDKSLLEKVDSARGSVSRSEYIERALAERLASLVTREAARVGTAGGDAALEVLREILRELREIRRLLGEGEVVLGEGGRAADRPKDGGGAGPTILCGG